MSSWTLLNASDSPYLAPQSPSLQELSGHQYLGKSFTRRIARGSKLISLPLQGSWSSCRIFGWKGNVKILCTCELETKKHCLYLFYIMHGGAGVSLTGRRFSSCVELAWSPHTCVGSLQEHWLPKTCIWVVGHLKCGPAVSWLRCAPLTQSQLR